MQSAFPGSQPIFTGSKVHHLVPGGLVVSASKTAADAVIGDPRLKVLATYRRPPLSLLIPSNLVASDSFRGP